MTQIYKDFTINELQDFRNHVLKLPDTPFKPMVLEDVENEILTREPDCNVCKCSSWCIAKPDDKRCKELRKDNGC